MDKNLFLFTIIAVFVSTAECQLFPEFGTLDAAVQYIVHPKAKPSTAMIELALKHLITQKHKDHLMEFVPHFLQLAIDMGVHKNDTTGNSTTTDNLTNMIYEKGLRWLRMRLEQKVKGEVQQQTQMLRWIIQTLLQQSRQSQEPVTLEDIFESLGIEAELPETANQMPMFRSSTGSPSSSGGVNMGGQMSMVGGQFGAHRIGANMGGLMPFGATFGMPMMMGFDMRNFMPRDANIGGMQAMGGADMEGPIMGGANFGGPQSGANMGGPITGGADMGGLTMGGGDMGGPTMGGGQMGGLTMGRAGMGGQTTEGADAGGPIMGGASMGGQIMGGANMGGLTMGGGEIGGHTMGGPDMGGLTMGGGEEGGSMNIGEANMGGPYTMNGAYTGSTISSAP